MSASMRRGGLPDASAFGDAIPRGRSRRFRLSRGPSFWMAAAIAFLTFAANAAVSPLYRVYQVQFGFSAITLTLLFAAYIVVLLATSRYGLSRTALVYSLVVATHGSERAARRTDHPDPPLGPGTVPPCLPA